MKRPSYRDAIQWIASNDDNEWLKDKIGHISVTACLVADMFGVDEDRVRADLMKAVERSK